MISQIVDFRQRQSLLNFRFLQTTQAIRLVRGTNPWTSSMVVTLTLVFLGLLDRPPELPSLVRRGRSLKKSSLGSLECGDILRSGKGLDEQNLNTLCGTEREDTAQPHVPTRWS